MKEKGLEDVLGKSNDLVGHIIIPFEIGGAADMYYYPNGIRGNIKRFAQAIRTDW